MMEWTNVAAFLLGTGWGWLMMGVWRSGRQSDQERKAAEQKLRLGEKVPEHPSDEVLDRLMKTIDGIEGTAQMPEAQLRQLVAHGKIMAVTTFDQHMSPSVRWIEPTEFGDAFAEEIKRGS